MISTVKDCLTAYEVTLADGTVLWVPKDTANADYARVEAWVSAGGTVQPS